MKFKIDKCPICQTDLEEREEVQTEGINKLFVCSFGLRQRNSEKYSYLEMPQSHTYEVSIRSLSAIQIIDIPPFALDSVCHGEICHTTLYKWVENRPDFNNEPGWIEIGEYPFIEIKGFKKGIKKIKRLLSFL